MRKTRNTDSFYRTREEGGLRTRSHIGSSNARSDGARHERRRRERKFLACYRRIACGVIKKGVFATQTWGGGRKDTSAPPLSKVGGAIAPPAPPAHTPMVPTVNIVADTTESSAIRMLKLFDLFYVFRLRFTCKIRSRCKKYKLLSVRQARQTRYL